MTCILVVDDERTIREIFDLVLKDAGYSCMLAGTGKTALHLLSKGDIDLVLLDMNLPDISGMDVLRHIKAHQPELPVIILTAFGTIRNAVEATRLGAFDYLEKPADNDHLLHLVDRALEVRGLRQQVQDLQNQLEERHRFSNIVGQSSRMQSVFHAMDRLARVDGTVLVTGESGTGKELVGRALHHAGQRSKGPFVVVNCGAIPKELVESEFFGHTRGAFTEARTEREGKFAQAHGGTLFLDEVGELPMESQVKLLRAIGEKEIVKVGGNRTQSVDVRVIAATNKNLPQEIEEHRFREDLYWRLAVLSIELPPLRERIEDIPLLCNHFIRKFNRQLAKEVQGFADESLRMMAHYPWPGNVREMENTVYQAVVFADEPWIQPHMLPPRFQAASQLNPQDLNSPGDLKAAADQAERQRIAESLQAHGGNREKTAAALGISRKTLFNKMKRLGLFTDDGE